VTTVDEGPVELGKIVALIREFVKARDWEQFHRPTSLAMSASIELGELLELFQWKSDDEIVQALHESGYKEAVGSEIADVLIYLLRLCDVTGVDITEALLRKMKKNEEKYPVKDWEGRAPSKLNRRQTQ
jgi:dCTP diphosphatase